MSAKVKWFPAKNVLDSRCFWRYLIIKNITLSCSFSGFIWVSTFDIYYLNSGVSPKKKSPHCEADINSYEIFVKLSNTYPVLVTKVGAVSLSLPSAIAVNAPWIFYVLLLIESQLGPCSFALTLNNLQ
jgi:hypothetical protein